MREPMLGFGVTSALRVLRYFDRYCDRPLVELFLSVLTKEQIDALLATVSKGGKSYAFVAVNYCNVDFCRFLQSKGLNFSESKSASHNPTPSLLSACSSLDKVKFLLEEVKGYN